MGASPAATGQMTLHHLVNTAQLGEHGLLVGLVGGDVVIERHHEIGRHQAPLLELLEVAQTQPKPFPVPEALPTGAECAAALPTRPVQSGSRGAGWEK
jgi:hypothetical protein